MWQVGEKLGRFRLEREIGQGSHGVVFVATDTALEAPVAVKILHPWLTQDVAVRDRFKRELLLARRVAHPGVCRLFDLHEEGEAFFITMDYVEGQTLLNIVKNEARLPALRGTRIMRGVCQALGAAHNAGVIHRDLKPANIIVRENDNPMILDFGTATAGDVSRVTRPGTAVGSMRFIAPEVFTGVSPSVRTDIYSLGVVAYVTFAGKLPYNAAAGALEMLEMIRNQPPQRLDTLGFDIPPQLADAVSRAMEKNPDHRFASALAFDEALAEVERSLLPQPPAVAVPAAVVRPDVFSVETAAAPQVPAADHPRAPSSMISSEGGFGTSTVPDQRPTRQAPTTLDPADNAFGAPATTEVLEARGASVSSELEAFGRRETIPEISSPAQLLPTLEPTVRMSRFDIDDVAHAHASERGRHMQMVLAGALAMAVGAAALGFFVWDKRQRTARLAQSSMVDGVATSASPRRGTGAAVVDARVHDDIGVDAGIIPGLSADVGPPAAGPVEIPPNNAASATPTSMDGTMAHATSSSVSPAVVAPTQVKADAAVAQTGASDASLAGAETKVADAGVPDNRPTSIGAGAQPPVRSSEDKPVSRPTAKDDVRGQKKQAAQATPSSSPPKSAVAPNRFDEAYEKARDAMVRKGLIAGDLPEVEEMLARAKRGKDAGMADAARAAVESHRIDRTFVLNKLQRFNARFDKSTQADIADKVDPLAREAASHFAAGRFEQANESLNRAFAHLRRAK